MTTKIELSKFALKLVLAILLIVGYNVSLAAKPKVYCSIIYNPITKYKQKICAYIGNNDLWKKQYFVSVVLAHRRDYLDVLNYAETSYFENHVPFESTSVAGCHEGREFVENQEDAIMPPGLGCVTQEDAEAAATALVEKMENDYPELCESHREKTLTADLVVAKYATYAFMACAAPGALISATASASSGAPAPQVIAAVAGLAGGGAGTFCGVVTYSQLEAKLDKYCEE